MYRLNYNHLFYFYTIARAGGVAAAARKLLLAQPTLSAQLSLFEKRIGRRLFERRKKRLVLTEEGRVALRFAEAIFRVGREFEDDLRDRPSPSERAIQIGAVYGLPKSFSHALLKTALSLSPRATLTCREGAYAALLGELKDYALDLILTDTAPPPRIGGFRSRLVGRIPIVLAAAPRTARRFGPADLARIPLIRPQSPITVARQIDDYLVSRGIEPRIVADVPDVESARRLALDGAGAAPMNLLTFEMSRPKGGLAVLGGKALPGLFEAVYLISASDRMRPNPLVERLARDFRLPKPSIAVGSRRGPKS